MHTHGGPIYMRIADTIEQGIHSGHLRAGDRLPPQRELADQLQVTLGTITRGYAEAEKRGLVRGQTGRGTFVTADAGQLAGFGEADRVDDSMVQLGLNFPLQSLDPPLAPILRAIASKSGLEDLTRYVSPAGLTRHRAAAALWLERFNVSFPPEEILLTVGSQHALTLAASYLLKPGERLLCEELTYPGIKAIAAMHGFRLDPVAMDDQGIVPESLDAAARKEGVRALYCMPPRHNPTTICFPAKRREELARVLNKHRLPVIEDATYDMPGGTLPAITSLVPELGFYVSSMSKCVAAGLRMGFLRAPAHFASSLDRVMTSTTWMCPPLMGEVMLEMVHRGVADQTVLRKRSEANARNALATGIFAGLSFWHHPDSYFIWLQLPSCWDPASFCEHARQQGVSIISAERFSVGQPRSPRCVRLSLSSPTHIRDLERALISLRDLLNKERPNMQF